MDIAARNIEMAAMYMRGATLQSKSHRGVYCLYPGTDRPFVAKVGRTQVGRCATAEEAAAARNAFKAARA